MMSKFSQQQQQQQQQHQNILQPKRLNSTDSPKIPKGGHRQPSGMITGQTLTLNGVSIGLPSLAQSATSLGVTTPASKKGSNTMAKRNARERNRVKQVNQGFQTLRQHIPETYRMKKMSKVDTLRCAVDYIRSMEQILEITPMPCPGIASSGDNRMMTTVSPYHSFSSPDMNQHLESICMEEGSSISLEQSYSSSFSENDEENTEYCSQNDLKYRNSLEIIGHQHHHQFEDQQERQECSETVTIVTTTGSNSIPLQALVTTTDGSSGPIVIPVQLQSSSTSSLSSSPLDKNGELLAVDENFNPPSSSSSSPFIRVVEIIQLQS